MVNLTPMKKWRNRFEGKVRQTTKSSSRLALQRGRFSGGGARVCPAQTKTAQVTRVQPPSSGQPITKLPANATSTIQTEAQRGVNLLHKVQLHRQYRDTGLPNMCTFRTKCCSISPDFSLNHFSSFPAHP